MEKEHKTYRIITYGCQMNEHDSEALAGMLERMGYRKSPGDEADVVLLNTCSVRENASRRLYGNVASLKRLKKGNPGTIIGICGCLAQQPGEAERIRKDLPHVDLVFGTHNLHRLPELLDQVLESRVPAFEILDESEGPVEGLPVKRESKLKAWVTIMFGCNNFCAYCIVPYVRGREKSRRPGQILTEVAELARDGVREVTLLGQNVNSYGKDLDEGVDFADLLAAVDKVPGLERIRFQTSHPRDVTDKLVEVMAGAPKVCEHLHLPLQSGSDSVLRKMNRGYTAAHYLGIVRQLRCAIPAISLTTDIIVGFPGESEEDFQKTLDIVREVRYDSAFTFAYSKRQGTPAAGWPDQVVEEAKLERLQRLIDLQNSISFERNQEEVGRVFEVMAEGPSQREASIWVGRTRTNKMVHFPWSSSLESGSLVRVRISEGQTHTLYGALE